VAETRQMMSGAVTFLDVLGWKGIWLRRGAKEVLGMLEDLVGQAQEIAKAQRGRDDVSETRVLSISDTIVLLTEGKVADVTPIHGQICNKLLPVSARRGIPLRGATSYGEFSASGTIVIGPAVDEAASWHENLDWIGVVLAPGSEFNHDPVPPWVQYAKAPVKGLGSRNLWCVEWGEEWVDDVEIRKIFGAAGPLAPAIAVKYMNTLDFLRARMKARVDAAAAPPA
jgi:hypothetical protein